MVLLGVCGASQPGKGWLAVPEGLAGSCQPYPLPRGWAGLGKKTTLDLYGGYNPFTFGGNKRFKHWLVQPEFRYWTCERFNGTFWGLHLHGGEFSVAGIHLPFKMFPSLKDHRYEGYFYGGGVSVGHQWVLSKRWNLEASVGVGYAHWVYDKYRCVNCSPKIKSGHKNYVGPTKVAVSLVYFIR